MLYDAVQYLVPINEIAPRKLSKVEFFHWVYMPVLLTEVIWDYADTLCDLCRQMRIRELKRATYFIADQRDDYLYSRNKFIPVEYRPQHEAHMLQFHELYAPVTERAFRTLRSMISVKEPALTQDWVYFLSYVYLTKIMIGTLHRYAIECNIKLNKATGSQRPCFVPKQITAIDIILDQFLGDHVGLLKTQEYMTYATELTAEVWKAECEDSPNQKKVQQSTPTKESNMNEKTETLQDKIQEAALVLHANVAMFYEKGNKAAGARARKASLELEKLCRQFRKESVAAGKADK